jgi:hypothetical protein
MAARRVAGAATPTTCCVTPSRRPVPGGHRAAVECGQLAANFVPRQLARPALGLIQRRGFGKWPWQPRPLAEQILVEPSAERSGSGAKIKAVR